MRRTRRKGKEHLQGRYCFVRFLRSDFERKDSDWSESNEMSIFDLNKRHAI